MATRLNIDQISNPNFSGANDAMRLMGDFVNRGFTAAGAGLDDIEKDTIRRNSNQLQVRALQYQDPNKLRSALADGSLFDGIAQQYLNQDALGVARNQTGTLLDQQGKEASTGLTNVQADTARYGLGRTQFTDQRADGERAAGQALIPVKAEIRRLMSTGNPADYARGQEMLDQNRSAFAAANEDPLAFMSGNETAYTGGQTRVIGNDAFIQNLEKNGNRDDAKGIAQAAISSSGSKEEAARRIADLRTQGYSAEVITAAVGLLGEGGSMSGAFKPLTAAEQALQGAGIPLPASNATPTPANTWLKGGARPTSGAEAATQMLRQFEGFISKPKWDVNADRVGYGSDTITREDGSVVNVTPGMQVSRADAERDLDRRLNTEFIPRARNQVGGANWDRLSPEQQGVLASVTYNYGSLPSNVVQAVGTGDTNAVAQAIASLSGHNDGVNANRRMQEANIFAGGGLSFGSSAPSNGYSATGEAFANQAQQQGWDMPAAQNPVDQMFPMGTPVAGDPAAQQANLVTQQLDRVLGTSAQNTAPLVQAPTAPASPAQRETLPFGTGNQDAGAPMEAQMVERAMRNAYGDVNSTPAPAEPFQYGNNAQPLPEAAPGSTGAGRDIASAQRTAAIDSRINTLATDISTGTRFSNQGLGGGLMEGVIDWATSTPEDATRNQAERARNRQVVSWLQDQKTKDQIVRNPEMMGIIEQDPMAAFAQFGGGGREDVVQPGNEPAGDQTQGAKDPAATLAVEAQQAARSLTEMQRDTDDAFTRAITTSRVNGSFNKFNDIDAAYAPATGAAGELAVPEKTIADVTNEIVTQRGDAVDPQEIDTMIQRAVNELGVPPAVAGVLVNRTLSANYNKYLPFGGSNSLEPEFSDVKKLWDEYTASTAEGEPSNIAARAINRVTRKSQSEASAASMSQLQQSLQSIRSAYAATTDPQEKARLEASMIQAEQLYQAKLFEEAARGRIDGNIRNRPSQ